MYCIFRCMSFYSRLTCIICVNCTVSICFNCPSRIVAVTTNNVMDHKDERINPSHQENSCDAQCAESAIRSVVVCSGTGTSIQAAVSELQFETNATLTCTSHEESSSICHRWIVGQCRGLHV